MSSETTRFSFGKDKEQETRRILTSVMQALNENGYNPINQLVGYFISGDPTYITNHNNARAIIRHMERDELLEVILRQYIETLSEPDQSTGHAEDQFSDDENYSLTFRPMGPFPDPHHSGN